MIFNTCRGKDFNRYFVITAMLAGIILLAGCKTSYKSAYSGQVCLAPADSSGVFYTPRVSHPPQAYAAESYAPIMENGFLDTKTEPLSTFSIDVDTASYANCRRFLNDRQLPPPDAVRIEELVNYFSYDYPDPPAGKPFSVTCEMAECPWSPEHDLLLIGIQGKRLDIEELPPSNLVFLLDVSGSMQSPDKLPLLKTAMRLLVEQLRPQDRVAIVTYSTEAALRLKPTPGSEKRRIMEVINSLNAGGMTAGAAGIQLAYKTAREYFQDEGNNRVILATDGDFNVGVSSDRELVRLIEGKRDEGIFLTVLGFGTGNLKDSKMEQIADKGNGNYAYIDGFSEAKKAMVRELGGTLLTLAKDVKIQIEFNPATVKSYRLIGYENRELAPQDFNNDRKDAGELGAGHTVTALYEIVPAKSHGRVSGVDPLKYQESESRPRIIGSEDLMTLKLRYKRPDSDESDRIEVSVTPDELRARRPSDNLIFASAVAEFGLLLRNSEYKGDASYRDVLARAGKSLDHDEDGYRSEFLQLVETAGMLAL